MDGWKLSRVGAEQGAGAMLADVACSDCVGHRGVSAAVVTGGGTLTSP